MPEKYLAQSSQESKQSLQLFNMFDFKDDEMEACRERGISPRSSLAGDKSLPLSAPLLSLPSLSFLPRMCP